MLERVQPASVITLTQSFQQSLNGLLLRILFHFLDISLDAWKQINCHILSQYFETSVGLHCIWCMIRIFHWKKKHIPFLQQDLVYSTSLSGTTRYNQWNPSPVELIYAIIQFKTKWSIDNTMHSNIKYIKYITTNQERFTGAVEKARDSLKHLHICHTVPPPPAGYIRMYHVGLQR